ncbi:L-lactate dehydrogenase [Lactiplantibacillus xiangfangensis]|uniref:L-lactate dehydrogenase n=1 Tax=Lactiplantibacillus xiangfangensis TaxID=942150 RepID=A0A0R2MGA0_9LACO|nr:L-lactate dehydrogenase [Lactiplantibacillus xiangfangensis]KRO11500.1 L-lactate dehydrogenase [Lactiplantibacillus xiangfangensis]
MDKKQRKVVIVGDGSVGSSFAFSLIQNCALDELVIVDLVKEHAEGDVKDLEDVAAFTNATKIHTGEYADAHDADIVIITAGVPRKPGESRLDLINRNTKILESIVKPVVASGFNGCFIVSSNPVDILTSMTQRLSGFPRNRVIGTGTSLDTARLRVALAQKLNVPTTAVDAAVLGEHGDSSIVNFDEIMINDQPLAEVTTVDDQFKAEIEQAVRGKGGQIIKQKGATFYGVAVSLMQICRAILNDENAELIVSAALSGQYGINDLYLGSPAIINRNGLQKVIEADLSDDERARMQHFAAKMLAMLNAA